ncbi:HWE histidine kinase domain-containing protein [Novosphingobium sp. Leaf2]|uniref:HWE histidine kinase domain-containing protein n=1 Tax=Novosphingobium sp. Leaf2 TaxID=1735670 RepID=UPI0009E9C0E1|nr:HWE histidine kinase domain-containing protein [Novosphingobium sp. Leaf2]
MADDARPVDLSTCDAEPIHTIGRIQSFGWLLSFSSDWVVNHASLNCDALFGIEARELVGMRAPQILSPDAIHEIRTRLQIVGPGGAVERLFAFDLLGDGRTFDIAVHASGRSFVIEVEPHASGKRQDTISHIRPMIERLRQCGTIEKLCSSAARNLRALTGFDRVMVYRFDADGSGEVLAESLNGAVDSFKGLHFPASDIPAQARRLYARNLLRIISDVGEPTVPIYPDNTPGGEQLDLSMSGLRAVSPIHIEYLRNMGVQASMSVSIMRRGKLWGLMACHHYAPLVLSYSVRTAAELFGEFFAYLLEQKEADFLLERQALSMRVHDEIMAGMVGSGSLLDTFDDFARSIAKVIAFDGIAGRVDGRFVSQGAAPDEAQFGALTHFLDAQGNGAILAADSIAALYPPAGDWIDKAAGMLVLPVSRTPGDYIVLFRHEATRDVNWAGNPDKKIEPGPLGPRLTPRKSFDIWKEERRGHAKAWSPDEVAAAELLRVTLLEVVLKLSDAVNVERERASQQQDVLVAQLNHRVRNILNLIRGLVMQGKDSARTIDEFADIVGSRIHALARAHDQVTRVGGSPASPHDLIRTEADAYSGDTRDRVVLTGYDATITPGAFTALALVIHELMTNACKYGALSGPRGQVVVDVARTDEGGLRIDWREEGGAPMQPPSNRGLGAAIIERTVPDELGGTASVEFPVEGLRARFLIPPCHVAAPEAP